MDSLGALGVDTDVTDRLDSQKNAYPDTYAPLGQLMTVRQIDPPPDGASAAAVGDEEPIYTIGRPEELFLGGFRLEGRAFGFTSIDDISLAGKSGAEAAITDPDVLQGRLLNQTPWAVETGGGNAVPAGTRRDAVAADTDGDGFREALTAYVEKLPNGLDELRLQLMDGEGEQPILDFSLLSGGRFLPAHDVRIAAADIDGDSRDELAIVIARQSTPGLVDTPVGMYVVDDALTSYAVIDEFELAFSSSIFSPSIILDIEGYHADHDNRDEIAVVVNASEIGAATPGNFEAGYFVVALNSDNDSITQLSAGPITGTVPGEDGVPREATAVIAGLATGDINGDSLDELIFGGLEEVVESCKELDADTGLQQGSQYVLLAFTGPYNDFRPLQGSAAEVFPPNCKIESGSEPFIMRTVHVNVLDFDGDEDADIQLNDLVLEEIPGINWGDSLLAFLNDELLIYGNEAERPYYDRHESVFAISDQTGDGVDDIIALYQGSNPSAVNRRDLKIYTWDDESSNGYRLATQILIERGDENNENPIIIPIDVNNDKVAQLRYTNEHFLDITEPLVLAAIAAAPCKRDIGQDGCSSSWGSTQSGAVGRDFSVKVSGSAGAGAGSAGVGLLGKWLFKVSASAARTTSRSYELSKSQTYSTGPFEDGVVFNSIPVDRYNYEVISDNTDQGSMPGEFLEVRLPRTPDIRIVERNYYNASITADAEPIDDRIFTHVPGNVSSYPNEIDKDSILNTQQAILEDFRLIDPNPNYDLLPAEKGLEVGPVLVGEGGGSTELSLEYTESEGLANELAMGFSFEAEMLFGAAISWEVGIELGRAISVSHGDSTLFSGSVDSIGQEFYADNVYGFGLFAYLQRLGDQELEVVNFWVEE
jgi:hypothetical protein